MNELIAIAILFILGYLIYLAFVNPIIVLWILGLLVGFVFLACSDGTAYENPKALAKYEEKLKRLQRKQSRQQKGSNRRKTTKAKIAQVWAKIRNIRKDSIQKATTDIVKIKQSSSNRP